ncbi:MAG: type II toxin-antitoxin system Phd/YefM family antitoxin [Bacteroidetes bacterium]|nr:type II toxin-antitoxin system Phd/YefM family antitoxin [Bacteroidota bacterium]
MSTLLIHADEFIGTRDLRKHLPNILQDIQETHRTFVVTSQGKPQGVLISVEEYVALIEMVQDLNNKELVKAINTARKELAAGHGKKLDDYIEDRTSKKPKRSKKIA